MIQEQRWWIREGYYPFTAGTDHYPQPGQVIQYYRRQKKVRESLLTQADLARILGISEKSVWAMENNDTGLDSFNRRVTLGGLLDIPPALLKLQGSSVLTIHEHQHPGQVIREYRTKKLDNGRSWTQADLARVLGISEKSVRLMENQDMGLDSLSRREFLITILDIPPAVLGLDALHFFEKTQSMWPTEPRLPQHFSLYEEKLRTYQALVPSYWEAHYASSSQDILEDLEKLIDNLKTLYIPVLPSNRKVMLLTLPDCITHSFGRLLVTHQQ